MGKGEGSASGLSRTLQELGEEEKKETEEKERKKKKTGRQERNKMGLKEGRKERREGGMEEGRKAGRQASFELAIIASCVPQVWGKPVLGVGCVGRGCASIPDWKGQGNVPGSGSMSWQGCGHSTQVPWRRSIPCCRIQCVL